MGVNNAQESYKKNSPELAEEFRIPEEQISKIITKSLREAKKIFREQRSESNARK